jgi:Xaa-Pro aminopeptidase
LKCDRRAALSERPAFLRRAIAGVIAIALAPSIARAQIPASAYPARRAAALTRIAGDVLIVPARGSFLADDQLGFVQAADFQYLTGLEELVGAVLVLDGSTSTSTLFLPPRNPLLTRGTMAADAESARSLQVSDVKPIDALEPWLRQRFARGGVKVYVAPTDARGAVAAPVPIAGSVVRWQAWLTPMGAASVTSAVAVLRPLRDIKDADELALLRRVGRTSGQATRRSRKCGGLRHH